MDMMGHIIDGRYAITYRIHVGRTATVYLAQDQLLRRSVVLKVLHPALAADPAYVERFRREACTAAALRHPNLISVYNLGTYAGTSYIVMEHVTGPSLGESLQAGGRVSEVRALQVAAQVADALAAAHERGVMHRDIRSHNILLAAGGQVKVTDFGCAYTAGLCAPEQAQFAPGIARHYSGGYSLPMPVDGQADLYNLGLVLCEMLTGRPMMAADGTPHYTGAMPLSAWGRLRLSPCTDAVVRRALAPNIAMRFRTADAMHAAIAGALSQITMAMSRPIQPHLFPAHASVHPADGQPRMGFVGLFRPRSPRLAS